jgi:protein TonB
MPTVFVADRDPVSRKGLAHILRQRGVAVEEFENGPALYAQALTEDPDLIVLETDLEEMDGFQVFARLQRRRPEKPFPVLFVTDFDHPRVARVCRQRGAVGYVAKSRPVEQIASAVLEALAQPEPLAGRPLAGALAWLQSHGKTGRLDIEASGRNGYVVLHKGRVLDAEFGPWRGEDVAARFAESLPEATYTFSEGADDFDYDRPRVVGRGAAAPSEPEAKEEERTEKPTDERTDRRTEERKEEEAARVGPDGKGAAPSKMLPLPEPRTAAATAVPTAVPSKVPPSRPESRVPRVSLAPPGPLEEPVSGAVAALRELREAERVGTGSGRVRGVLAAAAVVVLFFGVGAGLVALYSGSLPDPLAGLLALGSGFEGESAIGGPLAGSLDQTSPEPELTTPTAAPPAEPAQETTREAAASQARGEFDVAPAAAATPGDSFGPGTGDTASTPAPSQPEEDPSLARERARREAVERENAERARREAVERENAERARREAIERADAERARREAAERAAAREEPKPAQAERATPPPPSVARRPEPLPPAAPPAAQPAAPAATPRAGQPTVAGGADTGAPGVAPPTTQPAADAAAQRQVVPAPVPADRNGQARAPAAGAAAPPPAAAAPSPAAAAERGGRTLLKKPVLLKRGEDLYYPPELRAQGVGGSVLLNIRVGENGRAQQVEIARSSGYDAFDQAAVAAVGTFLWEPAQDASGPAEAWITQAVTFRP